jgi:very-short-patch-repair endonuclease
MSSIKQHSPLPVSTLNRCRMLRANATDAEVFLWSILRNRGLGGYKFRRQHPVEGFILDFFCFEAKLAIEVDGSGHLDERKRNHDEKRAKELSKTGIKILRFWNHEVMNQTEDVLNVIWDELIALTSTPSP